MKTEIIDPAIRHIHENELANKIAETLGITRQAISQWTQVPHSRVLAVADIIRWKPYQIRPDFYPPPKYASNRKASET